MHQGPAFGQIGNASMFDPAYLPPETLGNDESIGKTFTAYDSDMLHLYRIFMD
jgi:hypothetical protein